jgi:leucyl/phenylalanyl-tRNA--protein transferase
MSSETSSATITPQILLRAYSIGMFPMAEGADDPTLFWVDPELRGIFPLDRMIVARKLARTIRSDKYEVRIDEDFDAVIDGCAAQAPDRPNTWINKRIRSLYRDLFDFGFVHTVETFNDKGERVGGLYGVKIGAAFFGESMFHRATDASKVALMHLAGRLRAGGFQLLDTQFVTPHLASLGAIEVPRDTYHVMLDDAIGRTADFYIWPKGLRVSGAKILEVLGVDTPD